MNAHTPRRILPVALLLLVPLLAVAGSDEVRAALDFTTGVLTLVSLSAAVVWGLIATDRLLLSSRQRLVAQAVHRTVSVASIVFLLLHITVKIALGHTGLIGALVPFGLGFRGTAGLIGLGSLAAYLMITAAATGALRSAFAAPGGIAVRWRALHMLAYPAWCTGLLHGLYAGRPPKTWVIVLYALSLTAVAGALSLRTLPRRTRRRIADRITAATRPAPPAPEPRPAPEPPPATEAPPPAQPRRPPPAPPRYESPAPPGLPSARWPAPAPPPPAQAPPYHPPYDTPSAYDTEPLPGPFHAPAPGEPWHTPAGDRP
ncbi:hypothetical protein [Streptomyces sp. NBC_01465]|uniref:hypothetical protein n=1 Tax=Streptomyces sp. NBC_01465 TaxID=2903878 RepID=UPI002E359177|nr:hypothetical protein [Streptomyces sp. NBC_01465]